LALIARFGVTVHAFDPTPRTLQWINAQTLPPRFVFHPWGVAAHDGTGRFSPPHNPGHISHSLIERDTPWPAIEVPVRRLATLLGLLGHESIDLLKMDIEGAEYEVIDDLLSSGVAVDQLLIEFHHRWPEVGIDKTRKAIRQLHDAGYRIFTSSASGEEYGFLKNEWNHQPPNP
jgi:FkbM family methyltransferase